MESVLHSMSNTIRDHAMIMIVFGIVIKLHLDPGIFLKDFTVRARIWK